MGIELIKITRADYTKNILIIGVVHGDEPQGEYFIRRYLKINTHPDNNMFYIPRLNLAKTRKNPNGVDINRNFPTKNWKKLPPEHEYFGGAAPNSEQETKFLVNLINKINFNAVITIHSPYKIINYDGPAEGLAFEISKILDYPVQKDIGYPTPGSFGTYCGVERNIPTITIECGEDVSAQILYPKFEKLFQYLEKI